MSVVQIAAIPISAAIVAVKKFFDNRWYEMKTLNLEGRLGLGTYMAHRKEILEAEDKIKISLDHFNIGITGHAKTGKSTLINSIRGIRGSDPQAAPVGVNETTHEPSCYTFSDSMSNLKLYDFPGSGTISHPEENYFFRNGLCLMDVLIIVLQLTICEEEINLARDAIKYNVPVIFLRSKMDEILSNKYDDGFIDEKNQYTADEVLDELKKNHEKYMEEHAPDLAEIPCFHVSSRTIYSVVKEQNPNVISKRVYYFEEQSFFEKLVELTKKRETTEEKSTEQEKDTSTTPTAPPDEIWHEGVDNPPSAQKMYPVLDLQATGSNLCCICHRETHNILYLPCRDYATCQKCASMIQECPKCHMMLPETFQ